MDEETLADLQKVRDFMSFAQATGGYRHRVTYANTLKGLGAPAGAPLNEAEIESAAVELFRQKMPDYWVKNMRTDLLTVRALQELRGQSLGGDTLVLTNGCCSAPACPSTVFIGCVLEAYETWARR